VADSLPFDEKNNREKSFMSSTNIVKGAKNVAPYFNVSVRQIQRWIDDGMPECGYKTYNLNEIANWLKDKKIRNRLRNDLGLKVQHSRFLRRLGVTIDGSMWIDYKERYIAATLQGLNLIKTYDKNGSILVSITKEGKELLKKIIPEYSITENKEPLAKLNNNIEENNHKTIVAMAKTIEKLIDENEQLKHDLMDYKEENQQLRAIKITPIRLPSKVQDAIIKYGD